ncbi:hypothetical protein BC827DRAFT_1156489 [Russula dissimulans]|nr:hypothetical protein BC827DRAFT_1156489 [Russula dissimulans]
MSAQPYLRSSAGRLGRSTKSSRRGWCTAGRKQFAEIVKEVYPEPSKRGNRQRNCIMSAGSGYKKLLTYLWSILSVLLVSSPLFPGPIATELTLVAVTHRISHLSSTPCSTATATCQLRSSTVEVATGEKNDEKKEADIGTIN